MVERYDTLVIGGGMSGLPLALRAARHGRTALVERELLGTLAEAVSSAAGGVHCPSSGS